MTATCIDNIDVRNWYGTIELKGAPNRRAKFAACVDSVWHPKPCTFLGAQVKGYTSHYFWCDGNVRPCSPYRAYRKRDQALYNNRCTPANPHPCGTL